uniref:Fibrinogen C-terminal domain-containing protein n=1 Tax=Anopheles dirus TaxID=7168 RepID=A0A182N9Q4_9DIPT
MGALCVLLLPMIIGVLANVRPARDLVNTPFETSMADTRMIEQITQNFNDKIKSLSDRIEELKAETNRVKVGLNETSKTAPNMGIPDGETLEISSAKLNLMQDAMLNATQHLLEKFTKQLHNFSIRSEERFASLEHRLERLPEDTGVYFLQPDPGTNFTFEVLRDWTNNHGFGGNWIVFQRRFNGSVNFFRNWTEYKHGFGELRGEHWLGLDKLHAIVSSRPHELLIVMEDFEGVVAYAHYDDFRIGNESEKDEQFSTHDQDNDKHASNCAKWVSGAWWFYKCHQSHLNGEYLPGKVDRQAGIMWYRFRGSYYSLRKTKMMIRPVV